MHTDEKENLNFPIYKEIQGGSVAKSYILLMASLYMGKYFRISSYIGKPFLIYDFATAPLWISLYMGKKLIFFFISARLDDWLQMSWISQTVQFYFYADGRPAPSQYCPILSSYRFFDKKNYFDLFFLDFRASLCLKLTGTVVWDSLLASFLAYSLERKNLEKLKFVLLLTEIHYILF